MQPLFCVIWVGVFNLPRWSAYLALPYFINIYIYIHLVSLSSQSPWAIIPPPVRWTIWCSQVNSKIKQFAKLLLTCTGLLYGWVIEYTLWLQSRSITSLSLSQTSGKDFVDPRLWYCQCQISNVKYIPVPGGSKLSTCILMRRQSDNLVLRWFWRVDARNLFYLLIYELNLYPYGKSRGN